MVRSKLLVTCSLQKWGWEPLLHQSRCGNTRYL